jgi:hypothetical protein
MKQNVFPHKKTIERTIAYSEAGTAITIARLPAGAVAKVNVTVDEAFNNSNTINVGFESTPNKFINAFNVVTGVGKNSDVMLKMTDADREIIATVSGTATAGAVNVYVEFILPTSEEVSY